MMKTHSQRLQELWAQGNRIRKTGSAHRDATELMEKIDRLETTIQAISVLALYSYITPNQRLQRQQYQDQLVLTRQDLENKQNKQEVAQKLAYNDIKIDILLKKRSKQLRLIRLGGESVV